MLKASGVPSITSRPPAPWMCTSTNPGMADLSVASISTASSGTLIPSRGPISSMTPSRMSIPASGISPAGVSARLAWMRVVVMAAVHRSGNVALHKTRGTPIFVDRLTPRSERDGRGLLLKGRRTNKKEDSIESSSSRSESDSQAALIFTAITLAAGGGGAGAGSSRGFRQAQIACGSGLGHFVDYQFECRAASAGVEEDRFVHRTVFLLEALVIGQHVYGIAVLFYVGRFQLDLNTADFLRSALAGQSKFEIVALAHAAELIDFIMITSDERAHFAARHLDAVFGRVQIAFHASHVAIQLIEIVGARFGCQF